MKLFNSSRLNANPDGTFKDNDTSNGIIGTLINASIFNQIGYETDNLIKAGGLTPDENTLTQLKDAIQKLYGDADTELKNELNSKIDGLKAENIAYTDTTTQLGATNVQQAIEKIDLWLNGENIILDEQEHKTGRLFNNKPVYYKGKIMSDQTINIMTIENVDEMVDGKIVWGDNTFFSIGSNSNFTVRNYADSAIWVDDLIKYQKTTNKLIVLGRQTIGDAESNLKIITYNVYNPVVWYTKITDSRSF